MPFVENVSRDALVMGLHSEFDYEKDLLIQITDPDSEFPVPLKRFRHVVQYKFWDSEEDDGPAHDQAIQIAIQILTAWRNNQNILVHCQAGLCRSGAVAEAAIMLGFKEVHPTRWPNMRLGKQLTDILHLPPMVRKDYDLVFSGDWCAE